MVAEVRTAELILKSLVAGRWRETNDTFENQNPSDLANPVAVASRLAASDADEVANASADAAITWAQTTPAARGAALDRVADEIDARRDELGMILACEEGKTLPESVGEVGRAAQIFRFFAGETLRIRGTSVDSVRPGVDVDVSKEPVGVVLAITPWNFPIAIPAWKVAPALAFGNSVILKPADLVPGSAYFLADIIQRAGIPDGVFNLVLGRGSGIGNALVEHSLVDAVSFTGSEAVGRDIAMRCAARGAAVQLEMGGKNALVVLDDADLAVAVEAAVQGAFFSTGQRCTASSRLIVTDGIHDRFVEAMRARMVELRVGNAVRKGIDIGPVVDENQLTQDIDYIELGQSEGASLAIGGQRVEAATDGLFLEPTLFTEATNSMRISQEEIFGPVAAVIRAADYSEALAFVNDSPAGLCAGICTTSLAHARDFRRRADVGMVMINLPTAGVDPHVPFGGRKGSSYGPKEQGWAAADFYTQTKISYTAAGGV